MFGTVLPIVAPALLVIAIIIWQSDRCSNPIGVGCALVLGVLGLAAFSALIGYYAALPAIAGIGVVGIVVLALAVLAIIGAGILPTDFGLTIFALFVIGAIIVLIGPMVVTALVTHWREIPTGWWKLHLLENRDVIYRSLPW